MNPIERMNDVLSRVFPNARIILEAPLHEDGVWSMDVHQGDYHIAIDWSAKGGFGLTSDAEHGYGEPADERYADFEAALARCIKLIAHRAETLPPYPVRIKELRQKLKLSQADVATQMGVQQAAVSKLERRGDTHIGTLQSYAHALGGRLVLKVVFDNQEEQEIVLTPPE